MPLGTLFKAGMAIGGAALASDKISSALNNAVEKSTTALNQASGLPPANGAAQPSVGGALGTALFGRNTTMKCIGCHAPMSGKAGTQYQCPYCDTVQTLN